MSRKHALSMLPLVALLVWTATAPAVEVVVKNDSFVEGGAAVIVGDFIPGEKAGVRLTAPCDGTIVAVQIAWLEGTPGHLFSLQQGIQISDGSTFPTPGTQWAYLEAPLLTPGYINEFRYIDEAGTVPLSVPVSQGQQFYVALEFDEWTDVGSGGPSVIRDVDGCQAGKNVLYAIPGGWLNFCLFIQGDLVIRAVVECGDPTGACCLPDGSCADDLTAGECAAQGGLYQGDDSDCSMVSCPQPQGACCIPATGGCLDLTAANCAIVGGLWAGAGTNCATYVCFPSGACCLPDGQCVDDSTPEDCAALNGTFMGNGTTCDSVECPEPEGACCFHATGGCLVFTASVCQTAGGDWMGPGTDCRDEDQSGVADICEECAGQLRGDANCDGSVNSFDIDAFVVALTNPAAWEAQYGVLGCDLLCVADCNADGAVNVFDIDPFVLLLVSR